MVQAVDATSFLTASEASQQAKKTATLLKTLTVNALIKGESGVGKKSLASFILPDAPIVDASNFEELLIAIESSDKIIITNIDNSPNLKRLIDAILLKSIRVVATAKESFYNELLEDLFSINLEIPPLRDRVEDIKLLVNMFISQAAAMFGGEESFDIDNFRADISENAHSLKRQVTLAYLMQDIKEVELMGILENFISPKLGSSSDYRNFLHLYEVPLIRAGLAKYKSQLKLSDKLGLNRNTLRKKISDNKDYLEN